MRQGREWSTIRGKSGQVRERSTLLPANLPWSSLVTDLDQDNAEVLFVHYYESGKRTTIEPN